MFVSRSNLQTIYTFNVKVQIFQNCTIFTTKRIKRSVAKSTLFLAYIYIYIYSITEEIFSSTPQQLEQSIHVVLMVTILLYHRYIQRER
jgi:hypothetical protein